MIQDLSDQGLTQFVDLWEKLGVSPVERLVGIHWVQVRQGDDTCRKKKIIDGSAHSRKIPTTYKPLQQDFKRT